MNRCKLIHMCVQCLSYICRIDSNIQYNVIYVYPFYIGSHIYMQCLVGLHHPHIPLSWVFTLSIVCLLLSSFHSLFSFLCLYFCTYHKCVQRCIIWSLKGHRRSESLDVKWPLAYVLVKVYCYWHGIHKELGSWFHSTSNCVCVPLKGLWHD